MSQIIINSKNLSFKYSKTAENLNFQDIAIEKGQHTLLLGESGSGKTTLLHLLSGLSKPTTGIVTINGTDIYQLAESKLDSFRAQNLGFIFQEAHLLPNLTVLENVQLAQYLSKNKKDLSKAVQLLTRLQLQDKLNSYPKQLSRGQMQRVAIARALVNNPSLLLADEPTASLDDSNTAKVIELLIETAENYNATLLIATHDKRIKDHFSNTYQL